MVAILILSSVLSLSFLCYSAWISKGIPVSISEAYYLLGGKGWIFQLVMIVIAVTLYQVWVNACSTELIGLAFASCVSLMFVAIAPSFRLPLEGKVHYISASICCICSITWQILECLWDVTLCCGFLCLMLSIKYRKRWCWWVECAILLSVYMNLYRQI